jgi:hypothetical protein
MIDYFYSIDLKNFLFLTPFSNFSYLCCNLKSVTLRTKRSRPSVTTLCLRHLHTPWIEEKNKLLSLLEAKCVNLSGKKRRKERPLRLRSTEVGASESEKSSVSPVYTAQVNKRGSRRDAGKEW